jgi:hypothetical protein
MRRPIVSTEHRLFHFGAFGSTVLAFLLLARGPKSEAKTCLSIWLVGLVIEILQCATTATHILEWWDIRDDSLAVLAAYILIQSANAIIEPASP